MKQRTDKVQSIHNKNVSELDKRNRARVMRSDTVYAKELFEEGFPLWRHGSVKAMINEAQKFISKRVEKQFTHRRARSIWEGTARRVDGIEIDALRAAKIEEMRREQREARSRLASLDAMLANVDEAFHRETLAALREQAAGLGRVSGPRNQRGKGQ